MKSPPAPKKGYTMNWSQELDKWVFVKSELQDEYIRLVKLANDSETQRIVATNTLNVVIPRLREIREHMASDITGGTSH
jgi:hypothetical protein